MYVQNTVIILEVTKKTFQQNYWFLSVKYKLLEKVFLIVGIYHSPNSSHLAFLDFFEEWASENIVDIKIPVVVLGDFNLDWLKNTTYIARLKRFAEEVGLTQWVKDITRPNENSEGTIIDLVFTNFTEIKIKVLKYPKIGDHNIICIDFENIKSQKNPVKLFESRGKNLNYDLVVTQLLNKNWEYRNSDIDLKLDRLYNNIFHCLDDVAPKKEVKIFPHYKPWWNKNVEDAVKLRDLSYKEYTNKNKPPALFEQYKTHRNNALKVIRKEKQIYFERKVDECRSNSLEMWKTLKTLMPKQNSNNTVSQIVFDDEKVEDINVIPNRLNKYFVNSISDIVTGIDQVDSKNTGNLNKTTNLSKSMFSQFNLIDKESLKKIVFSLPNKGSPDNLGIEIIKKIYNGIEDPLINLINSSLEQGVVPSLLKISTVVPVPKKENSDLARDFRPINMLVGIEKILEKCVYFQLLEYIEINNILSKRQSGFRKKHSCETAIQDVLDHWKNVIDNGLVTIAVFVDLQRAFETINRKKLIKKLQKMGISGVVLKWL